MIQRMFRKVWAGWMRFALLVGVVNRYVFLTVFYFAIVSLVHLCLRLGRVDLLDRRLAPAATYWRDRDRRSGAYEHQF